ncbi:PLU-1-like protein-domain-containing protein [Paraphysoderma sedebokerense]|nr:PLU-1-like protein-domain-containing protein [Paraphysoderma sedebokerense]
MKRVTINKNYDPEFRLKGSTKSPPLDLNSVSRFISRPSSSFLHNIPECPTYYPTAEEFQDPICFVKKIHQEAVKYGICKIVPPKEWNPLLALDTEVFRFKTRIQRLNTMDGTSRAHINYVEGLLQFHNQLGKPVHKNPMLGKKRVNLYQLKIEVASRGGLEMCDRQNQWSQVGTSMGYGEPQSHQVPPGLRNLYVKYIHPYEQHLAKHFLQTTSPTTVQTLESLFSSSIHSSDNPENEANDTTNAGRPRRAANLAASQSIKSQLNDDNDFDGRRRRSRADANDDRDSNSAIDGAKRRRSARVPGQSTDTKPGPKVFVPPEASLPKKPIPKDYVPVPGEELCEICGHDHTNERMIICQDCSRGFHTFCLDPPLNVVPRRDWFCAKCLLETGNDFGFEDGNEYSLSEFQKVADNFKVEWFEQRRKNRNLTELEVETEFWRLVECPYEAVDVEYGADLHSTVHGSGFPTRERDPLEPYADHPWNLNNLPTLSGSLFRNIKSDISGMMVPWVYVGQCFSTFCWHNEDHYTYSINYNHIGDTKTWYTIPGEDAEKFEDSMRQAVPDLFEQQPDLLFQIVTMLSPKRLVESGVNVYGCNQRAGEFVVTFPQAYHGGFNQGFNIAEAVNFAPEDWLSFGLKCVQRYKAYKKLPVFSHDELLINTALRDGFDLKTAIWLKPHLSDLLKREKSRRQELRERLPESHHESIDTDAVSEEHYQCFACKEYCFLSSILCESCNSNNTGCMDHFQELCQCGLSSMKIRLRYSDADLEELVNRIVAVADRPSEWVTKYNSLFQGWASQHHRILLKSLQQLYAESQKIDCIIPEATHLKRFLVKVDEWVDRAQRFIQGTRKKHNRRRMTSDTSENRSVEYLKQLLEEVDQFYIDTPEIQELQAIVADVEQFEEQVQTLLDMGSDEISISEAKILYDVGDQLDLDLKEMSSLEAKIKELEWYEKVQTLSTQRDGFGDLKQATDLLKEMNSLQVNQHHDLAKLVKDKVEEGERWKKRVEKLFDSKNLTLDDLEDILEETKSVPVTEELLEKLIDVRKKAVDISRTAKNLLSSAQSFVEKQTDSVPTSPSSSTVSDKKSKRPTTVDVKKVQAKAQELPISASLSVLHELNNELKKSDAWCMRLKRILGRSSTPKSLSIVLSEMLAHIEPVVDLEYDTYRPPLSKEDMNDEAALSSRLYCYCRKPDDATFMVECDDCHEWYHTACLNMTKKGVKEVQRFVCGICDPSNEVSRKGKSPYLDDLRVVLKEGFQLCFVPPEWYTLDTIVEKLSAFESAVMSFIESKESSEWTREDVLKIKFYLRKCSGLDVICGNLNDRLRGLIDLSLGVRYCLCQMPYSYEMDYIGCDQCNDWFHIGCVNVTNEISDTTANYTCPVCCLKNGEVYQYGEVKIPESYPPYQTYLAKKQSDKSMGRVQKRAHDITVDENDAGEKSRKRKKRKPSISTPLSPSEAEILPPDQRMIKSETSSPKSSQMFEIQSGKRRIKKKRDNDFVSLIRIPIRLEGSSRTVDTGSPEKESHSISSNLGHLNSGDQTESEKETETEFNGKVPLKKKRKPKKKDSSVFIENVENSTLMNDSLSNVKDTIDGNANVEVVPPIAPSKKMSKVIKVKREPEQSITPVAPQRQEIPESTKSQAPSTKLKITNKSPMKRVEKIGEIDRADEVSQESKDKKNPPSQNSSSIRSKDTSERKRKQNKKESSATELVVTDNSNEKQPKKPKVGISESPMTTAASENKGASPVIKLKLTLSPKVEADKTKEKTTNVQPKTSMAQDTKLKKSVDATPSSDAISKPAKEKPKAVSTIPATSESSEVSVLSTHPQMSLSSGKTSKSNERTENVKSSQKESTLEVPAFTKESTSSEIPKLEPPSSVESNQYPAVEAFPVPPNPAYFQPPFFPPHFQQPMAFPPSLLPAMHSYPQPGFIPQHGFYPGQIPFQQDLEEQTDQSMGFCIPTTTFYEDKPNDSHVDYH